MSTITDTYGRVAAQDASGFWTCGGITIGPCDATKALATLNGMAPEGWAAPVMASIAWTFQQFFSRFTAAEQQAIFSATAWQVKAWIAEAGGAQSILPTDPVVIAGVQYLVAQGLLTSDRATAILTPP
jgi:hypothetical protein